MDNHMQHQDIDHEISRLTKASSARAKNKDFNGAITEFDRALLLMSQSGLFYGRKYVKAIPYFQKAGRYSELEEYCDRVLIPLVEKNIEDVFYDKPVVTKEFFLVGVLVNIYDKLQLCAKRERVEGDFEKYGKRLDSLMAEQNTLRVNSERESLRLEYNDLAKFLGELKDNYENWPKTLRERFKEFS